MEAACRRYAFIHPYSHAPCLCVSGEVEAESEDDDDDDDDCKKGSMDEVRIQVSGPCEGSDDGYSVSSTRVSSPSSANIW